MFWGELFSSWLDDFKWQRQEKTKKTIDLREINKNNWSDCVNLSVSSAQRGFLPDNSYSLAQAAYEPECVPLGIYANEKLIGFAMYATTEFAGEVVQWIYRLMIDAKSQNKGFGKEAVIQLIKYIKSRHNEQVILSYVRENKIAKNLYASCGFNETGERYNDEVVARLA